MSQVFTTREGQCPACPRREVQRDSAFSGVSPLWAEGEVRSLWAQRTERSHQSMGTPGKAVKSCEKPGRILLSLSMRTGHFWCKGCPTKKCGFHSASAGQLGKMFVLCRLSWRRTIQETAEGGGWKFGWQVLAALTAPMKTWWSGMMAVGTPPSDRWSYP